MSMREHGGFSTNVCKAGSRWKSLLPYLTLVDLVEYCRRCTDACPGRDMGLVFGDARDAW